MKRFVFLILTIIISSVALPQGSKKIIRQFVTSVIPNHDGIDYVSSSLNVYTIKEIKGKLSKDTIKNSIPYNKNNAGNNFIPSGNERKKINKALRKLSGFRWSLKYFHDIKLISRDSLDIIFKDRKNLGWNYFHKVYGEGFHSFSKPIFLRNKTICIFYSAYNCGGLCGNGQLEIYKRINNQWELFITVSSWMS